MKNYFGFVNDHSGSMGHLATAAANDYNTIITSIKEAASAEMLDTIVSVVAIGVGPNAFERRVTVSNPHVLKPVTNWEARGGTPLYHGLLDLIRLHENLPDIDKSDVSMVMFVTTDGEAGASDRKAYFSQVASKIREKMATGRWTFVFRVPRGARRTVEGLGVPYENIQEWDTSVEGMKKSTVQTQAAVQSFYTARAAGAKSSTVFYTSSAAVDTSKLADVSKETSLYVVNDHEDGNQIKDFILSRRMEYLIGAAFYQLTKTEARVQPTKLILIRDRSTGAVYAGKDARQMIGLDTVNNARLHPNHGNGNYDIFIQSESVNRKLVKGTGVLYWAVKGRPMTQADLDKYAPKAVSVPAVPSLPAAPATGRPTPSPLKPTPAAAPAYQYSVNGKPVIVFESREAGRKYANGRVGLLKDRLADDLLDAHVGFNPNQRWYAYL